jgi:signal transduction histidine kinase
MKISLLLTAGQNEQVVAAAIEAAQAVFPGSSVRRAKSFENALEMKGAAAPELLVMFEASEAEIARATQALDESHLPRWAVVASGGFPNIPFAEVIADAGWQPGILARVFRGVMELHLLRRERDRLLGDILTIGTRITHDLRTPLGGILAATEALNEADAADPDSGKGTVQPIAESIQDLVGVIGQLTLLAKASALQPARKDFDMHYAVSRAVMGIEVRANREGATLVQPESWPQVRGDPAHTESIWRILLENALKYAGKGPTIEIGWARLDEGHQFWVRDNGNGVASSALGTLYQPFHRLHEASAARGLGLAIVERLAGLQGGRCGYEQPAEGGARFFFTLPSAGTA